MNSRGTPRGALPNTTRPTALYSGRAVSIMQPLSVVCIQLGLIYVKFWPRSDPLFRLPAWLFHTSHRCAIYQNWKIRGFYRFDVAYLRISFLCLCTRLLAAWSMWIFLQVPTRLLTQHLSIRFSLSLKLALDDAENINAPTHPPFVLNLHIKWYKGARS